MPNVVFKVGDDVSTDLDLSRPLHGHRSAHRNAPVRFRGRNGLQLPAQSQTSPARQHPWSAAKISAAAPRASRPLPALKGHELTIVAKASREFLLQNAINLGLRMVVCPSLEATEGDELEITATDVVNKTSGKTFPSTTLPKSRQAIIDAGGLIPFTRQRLLQMAS